MKSMNTPLRKVIGSHTLTLKEMTEAILNCWPLIPAETLNEDAVDLLTPGHFLIGRSLQSRPYRSHLTQNIYSLH